MVYIEVTTCLPRKGLCMLRPELLKKARLRVNLSQNDIAEKLGVTRQSVSKWENGRGYLETDNLVELSKLYKIPLDSLFDSEEKLKLQKSPEKSEYEGVILFVLTGVAALIPFLEIFLPMYVLYRNKKENRYYRTLIVAKNYYIERKFLSLRLF